MSFIDWLKNQNKITTKISKLVHDYSYSEGNGDNFKRSPVVENFYHVLCCPLYKTSLLRCRSQIESFISLISLKIANEDKPRGLSWQSAVPLVSTAPCVQKAAATTTPEQNRNISWAWAAKHCRRLTGEINTLQSTKGLNGWPPNKRRIHQESQDTSDKLRSSGFSDCLLIFYVPCARLKIL